MKTQILFIDIPIVSTKREGIIEKIVSLKYKAQDILYAQKGFNYAYQRKNSQFNRGLLTLGNYIKSHGFNAMYCHYTDSNLISKLKELNDNDFVGIPTITAFMDITKELIKKIKEINPALKIVLGGYHATARVEETFNEMKEVDYIISGEGEIPMLNLIRAKFDSKGISYRKYQELKMNIEQEYLDEEIIPNPDYQMLPDDLDSYNYNIQTVRGCPNKCFFCVNSYFWKKVRFRPIEKVKEELKFLQEHLESGKFIHFSDNIFTLDKKRSIKICKFVIDEKIDFQFSCDSMAQYLDEELIKIMAKAGFKRICLGFEDSNDSTLQTANKDVSLETNIRISKLIKKLAPEIIVEAYWITGLPNSNHETLFNNLKTVEHLIEENIVDFIATSTVFTPLPGSPFYDQCNKYGLSIKAKSWEEFLRANFMPVYELDNLSTYELLSHFILFESLLLRLYLKKLDLSPEDVLKLHPKVLNKKVDKGVLR